MNCANPLDPAVLADYWLAMLPPDVEEGVEQHLLGCDQCNARLGYIIALSSAVRRIAREGSLRMVVSDAFLQSAVDEGLHVRHYAPPPGGSIACTVTEKDDLLIARLSANLSGAKRVDLSLCNEQGVEQVRLSDIPVRLDTNSILYQESITFAKSLPTTKLIARLIARDDSGSERLLGEYTFDHTRSISGPAAW